jgi:hypothetical protein
MFEGWPPFVRPTAYRNSQRLMKLATLLRAQGIDNLEGTVWAMVARKAIQVKVRGAQTCHSFPPCLLLLIICQ